LRRLTPDPKEGALLRDGKNYNSQLQIAYAQRFTRALGSIMAGHPPKLNASFSQNAELCVGVQRKNAVGRFFRPYQLFFVFSGGLLEVVIGLGVSPKRCINCPKVP